jgi:TonB-linked SusC/RagA family outer membrane protein
MRYGLLALLLQVFLGPPLFANEHPSQQGRPIVEILSELSETYEVLFSYDSRTLKTVEVDFEFRPQESLESAINRLLDPINYGYESFGDKYYVLFEKSKAGKKNLRKISRHMEKIEKLEQQGNLTLQNQKSNQLEQLRSIAKNAVQFKPDFPVAGTVVDEDGLPLIGVNILIKGTTRGAVTDLDGNFSLDLVDGQEVLVFSYTGYEPVEVAVNGRSVLQVTMSESVSQLDEIVVIGYGTQKKSDLTGAVSQVKEKDINAFPATNIMQSLSGRAPGVQVLQTTGAPGAAVAIRIRGTNSIQGGNDPLYVIDGFPFSGNPTNLNTSDIESIEILKDASATAIYGSRGANGVVLITTKQGKRGRTVVDFESSYSTQSLRKKLELMNGREYATLANEQAANDNIAPYFSQAEIDNFGEGFDWQELVFQEAPIQTAALNVSGGNEKTQFAVAGSFFGQEGIVKGSDYNRYSLRANFNHHISDKFRITLSNTLSYLNTKRRDSEGGSRGNSMIAAAIAAAPISTPYNDDGSYRVLANEYPFVAPDIINPLNFINEQQNEIKANVVLTNAALIYEPIPELTIKISGGIENRDDRTDSYTTRNFFNSTGRAGVSTGQFRSLLSENTISYNKTFNEQHRISAVAGFTYQDFTNTSLSAGGIGFLSDAFETYDLEASENPGIPASGYSKATLLSYLGRVNYSLHNKYLLTVSFRSDGSSRYSAGNKWGYFPSGAVAWRLIDEAFVKELNLFSDLKLRASWGMTGSQAISPYATLNLLSAGLTVFDDQLYNTFAPGTRLPGDLRWETTEQFDIGLDFGLFNNRLFITADYYVKNTRDLLNTVRLPSSMGFTSTIQNVGEVQNKGFELAIDAKVATGRFNWDLNANISFNRNRVVRLHDGEDILAGRVSVLVIDDNVSILKEGEPIGLFWGYVEDGYNEEGLIKIKDLDGNGAVNADDKTRIGDPNPDFIYGLNSSMSYKNFELNLFIQGSYGNDIFNASAIPVTLDYGQGLNMPKEVFYDHWTPDNTNAKYPVISRKVSGYASDRWIEDGSFLRLRNVELAYNILFEQFGVSWIRNAKLYVSGQNLITLTQYSWWDPEVNSRGAGVSQGIDHFTYPLAKTFTVGLRAGF